MGRFEAGSGRNEYVKNALVQLNAQCGMDPLSTAITLRMFHIQRGSTAFSLTHKTQNPFYTILSTSFLPYQKFSSLTFVSMRKFRSFLGNAEWAVEEIQDTIITHSVISYSSSTKMQQKAYQNANNCRLARVFKITQTTLRVVFVADEVRPTTNREYMSLLGRIGCRLIQRQYCNVIVHVLPGLRFHSINANKLKFLRFPIPL
ncbi:hypothetical protein V1517DRAFT_92719 [Lipomyces orientalis]|uniref:Uncharacterized protein n=1 Tax=Lipomyces orientalis TaxID=1233043 RepID=A0ACC3TCE8_9ASCO